LSYDFVGYAVENGVAEITLDRPDKLNSFHGAMARELQTALKTAGEDDAVRALLLTGAGRGFCAGQDLAEVLPKEGAPPLNLADIVRDSYNPVIRLLRAIEKPIVAAVNGVAAGAGANMAFACDLTLAAEKASFVQSFCQLGLVPDSGGTFILPRLVGMARATALTMLGDKLTAQQALELGLIYRVCADEALMDEARALARKLATRPTKGLGYIKRALNASWANDLDAQLELERELQGLAGQTEDYAEGVAAFLEKRKPHYRGR